MDESVEMYLLEDSDLTSMDFPETDEYLFIGCTLTPNGNEFVTKVPSEPVKLYAKWRAKDDILPFKFSEDYSEVIFTFRPKDYNYCPDVINSVHLMSSFTEAGWGNFDVVNKLTKDTDGNYSITLSMSDVNNGGTFKFRVNEQNWFGAGELKYNLPSEYSSGQHNDFKLVFPESTITFNLNGGSTAGYLQDSYSTQYYLGSFVTDFFRRNVCYDNPTKDGFAFAGWTLTKDGKDFVCKMPWGNAIVYAKWVTADELVLPYEFSEDKITFIFRPSDYNVSLSSSINYDVYLMSSFTLPDDKWSESDCSEHNRLTKGNDGNYRLTVNTSDVFNSWLGFQFFVKGDRWYGVKEYTQNLVFENIADDGANFMVVFPE
jgi:uncharacterized repeat protein (TIGR02543 family)